MPHHQRKRPLFLDAQRAEYRFGVPGERAFQFPQFAIIRPAQQVIAPGALLVIEQRQNMLEQRQRFRCGRGSIAQRLIQALTRLQVLLEAQTGCFGR